MRVRDLLRTLAIYNMDDEVCLTVCVGESDNEAAVSEVQTSEALAAVFDGWHTDTSGALVLCGYFESGGGAA